MATFEEFVRLSGESYELLQQFRGSAVIQNQFGIRRMALVLLTGGQSVPSGEDLDLRVRDLGQLITDMRSQLPSAIPGASE